MNPREMQNAIAGLRWVLGLVVLGESAHFALSASSARQVSHFGLPQWFPVLLGGIEMLAAILFLMPVARRTGGYALLLIFAVAAAIHARTGGENLPGAGAGASGGGRIFLRRADRGGVGGVGRAGCGF